MLCPGLVLAGRIHNVGNSFQRPGKCRADYEIRRAGGGPKWTVVCLAAGVVGLVVTSAGSAAAPRRCWPVLPRPSHNNVFYLMPIWEHGLDTPKTSNRQLRAQIAKMKTEFGRGNFYNQLGFSSIYTIGHLHLLLRQLRVFKEENIHRGVILALQTHDGGAPNPNGDLRNYQWRLNGKTWAGIGKRYYSTPQHPQIEGRDWLVVTPSRYATAVRAEVARTAARWAGQIKRAMKAYPGVITAVNFSIEEELAEGGIVNDQYLGDYSPFAITEFRDWLRHRGLYAPGAPYAGQGAPQAIVGRFVKINGHWTSPFYDDPTPNANANGPGYRSFNATFGTHFRTWTLKYWDLTKYPAPIVNGQSNPTPHSGQGYTAGGFDAPRVVNHSRWWKAWNWTYPGRRIAFPPGNPAHPAFGFRQVEVAHFVRDVGAMLIRDGLPKRLLYAHQIPAELIGDKARLLSSGSTIWSGYLPQNGHLGITRFGPLNTGLITQYSKNWGIFEWHPAPFAKPGSVILYQQTLADLRQYVPAGAHVLFPGWWHAGRVGKIFPLNNSMFAKSIRRFLAEQNDVPHWDGPAKATDFSPPTMHGLRVYLTPTTCTVSWSNKIWKGLAYTWNEWPQFNGFQLQSAGGKGAWEQIPLPQPDAVAVHLQTQQAPLLYRYRVRAWAKNGSTGRWIKSGGL